MQLVKMLLKYFIPWFMVYHHHQFLFLGFGFWTMVFLTVHLLFTSARFVCGYGANIWISYMKLALYVHLKAYLQIELECLDEILGNSKAL